MIQPNELRINSYYNFQVKWSISPGIYKLDVHEMHVICELNCFDEIEPVPLTEEWLTKLGFDNTGIFENKVALPDADGGWLDGAMEFEKRLKNDSVTVYMLNGEFHYQLSLDSNDYGWILNTTQIMYLHQLQNLCFILTEQELAS